MSTFTINDASVLPVNPGGTGSPHTIQFPETTLLVSGHICGISIVTNSTTGVTLSANPSSASDKIVSPLSPTSTPASTLSSLNLSTLENQVILWMLTKIGYANNTWQIIGKW